jgi:RNA polymerase sigma-70 factor (ECF subfamily)
MGEPRSVAGQWLPSARAGSQEALGQALEACRGYLLLIAQMELDPGLQGKGSPSDLVQQTLAEAVRDFNRFNGDTEAELLQWLRRLLLNNVADFSRQYRETGKRQIGREVPLQQGESSSDAGLQPTLEWPSPSSEAMAHEQEDAVHRVLARLPEDYRRVIVLRYQESRSFDEIGAELHMTANAARKLLLRAVERVRQELDSSHDPGAGSP